MIDSFIQSQLTTKSKHKITHVAAISETDINYVQVLQPNNPTNQPTNHNRVKGLRQYFDLSWGLFATSKKVEGAWIDRKSNPQGLTINANVRLPKPPW
jgi:hypothetical protein